MKKKINKLSSLIISSALLLSLLAGCNTVTPSPVLEESIPDEPSSSSTVESSSEETPSSSQESSAGEATINIAGLKGPTGLGMVHLMNQNEKGESKNKYNFILESTPDLISGKVLTGEVDIAAVPVNLAAVLYKKSEEDITFLGVNTLGVLYLLTNGTEITSLEDLRGKTIYTTGQNATPEYSLKYILTQAGLVPDTDVNIVFETENPTLQAKLVSGEIDIAVLPEPFVSVVTSKNPEVKIALDLTKEWENASNGELLTTGGVIVQNQFLNDNPQLVADFVEEYSKSCELANSSLDETAQLAVKYEILPSEEIASQAIPRSNITFLSGESMRKAVGVYLEILFESNPQSIGGSVPDETFFYDPEQ